MLKALKARRDDELLDVGCGVGRPIAVAARMPFRRLFGVEVSSTLSEMASASFARYAGRVAIFNADVRDFEIPDTVSCIYMSNPFHGEPMDATVSAIKRSQGRQPRIIRIVVFNEGHFERSAEGCGWIQRVERRSVGFPVKGSWALYHASPAEPAG
jgi:SAM-dependent methyltransferase